MLEKYIEEMRESLHDRNLKRVAESIGVHYMTLYNFVGAKVSARIDVLIKIDNYLNKERNNG